MFRTIALTGFAALFAATAISLAPPAQAQIGNIFSDPAPRPPGNIPRGNQAPDDEEEVPELPQGRLLPTPNPPLPGQGLPAAHSPAAGAGCASAGRGAVEPAGAAARPHGHSAEPSAGHRGRAATTG